MWYPFEWVCKKLWPHFVLNWNEVLIMCVKRQEFSFCRSVIVMNLSSMHGSRLKTSGTVVLLKYRDLHTEDLHNIYFTPGDTKMIRWWNVRDRGHAGYHGCQCIWTRSSSTATSYHVQYTSAPERESPYSFCRRLGGPEKRTGVAWMREYFAPTGFRTPNRQTRSESPYRRRCPGSWH